VRELHARIVSCTSERASLWLTAKPGRCGQTLSNDHCIMAIRQRIGAPLFRDLPPVCSCGDRIDHPHQYAHFHWCRKVKAPAVTLRHNHVATTLNTLAKLAGLTTRVECTQPTYSAVLNRTRKLRPDLLLIGGSATNFVDVAVCHPTAPYRVAKGLLPRHDKDTTLHAINALADLKTRKYRHLATQYQATFLPFVCDVYGAMGPGAHELLRWMISEASRAGSFTSAADLRLFRSALYTRVSIAIQRATAIAAVDAARRIREHAAAAPARDAAAPAH
jgi:hypothetical protein